MQATTNATTALTDATVSTAALAAPCPLVASHDVFMAVLLMVPHTGNAADMAAEPGVATTTARGRADAALLSALSATCRAFRLYILKDWTTIVAAYTRVTVLQEWRDDYVDIEDEAVTTYHFCGHLHRVDGPAIESRVYRRWYSYGRTHSFGNQPAIEDDREALRVWYYNGVIHRDGDLPASISPDHIQWYRHGIVHRDGDLPASRTTRGWHWYVRGRRHRDGDKPAVILRDTEAAPMDQGWYEDPTPAMMLELNRLSQNRSTANNYITMRWYRHGQQHRDGGLPASICSDGGEAWYIEGRLHREDDQPAVINADGGREWYMQGSHHRDEDKPAVITPHAGGTLLKWYKNGLMYRSNRPS